MKTTTAFVARMRDGSYWVTNSGAELYLTPSVERFTSVTVDRGKTREETTQRLIEAGKWFFDRGLGVEPR